jgi:hypothetical protein
LQGLLPPEGGDTNFFYVSGHRSGHERFLGESLPFSGAAVFDSAPWGLQAGHACPLFFNSLINVLSDHVV